MNLLSSEQGGGDHRQLAGIAPTGKTVGWRGVSILRVKDGRFTEMWQVHDTLGLLRQLGATIVPPQAAG